VGIGGKTYRMGGARRTRGQRCGGGKGKRGRTNPAKTISNGGGNGLRKLGREISGELKIMATLERKLVGVKKV